MIQLGIIETPSLSLDLMSSFDNNHFHLQTINSEEELQLLDGVILPVLDRSTITKTIDWLITCMNQSELFVWVYTTISLEQEQSLLLKMGVNGIVEDEEKLAMVVQNLYQRIRFQSIKEIRTIVERDILNESNQSVIVNGHEKLLTRMEYTVFSLLYKQQNNCITYEELMDVVYSDTSKRDISRVANVIFHLRTKIDESNEFKIETVRSKGYRLVVRE